MDIAWNEWFQFIVRWVHLIAGISWIGNSFYFMWLDTTLSLSIPKNPKPNTEGELWMVHGGGYYFVEKRKIAPGELPPVLHWFKWEATFTWISGFFLLAIVYYLGQGVFLIDPSVSNISVSSAILLSLALVFGSWVIYDLLWQSKISKSITLATTISLVLVLALIFILTQYFSGRAAFIHLGAIFGTLLVLNVWVRILPAQRKMIQAAGKNEIPDYDVGKKAKWRSTHNSYMTLPALFTMVSNHLPAAYSGKLNWLVLLLLCVLGALVRHMMLAWNKNKSGAGALIPIGIIIAILFIITSTPKPVVATAAPFRQVSFSEVQGILNNRCLTCHARQPTDPTTPMTAGGVSFEDPQFIKLFAERIKYRAVTTKTMPLANKTGITDEERDILEHWVNQGANIQ